MHQENTSYRRAARFSLRVPMLYREHGTASWYSGVTENVSCSGVLFQAKHGFDTQTAVDLAFVLPTQFSGEGVIRIGCHGVTVRKTDDRAVETQMAVAISNTQLMNQPRLPHGDMNGIRSDAKGQEPDSARHSVNNLLEVVMGHAEMILLREGLDLEVRDSLQQIKKAAMTAAALLRQISAAS